MMQPPPPPLLHWSLVTGQNTILKLRTGFHGHADVFLKEDRWGTDGVHAAALMETLHSDIKAHGRRRRRRRRLVALVKVNDTCATHRGRGGGGPQVHGSLHVFNKPPSSSRESQGRKGEEPVLVVAPPPHRLLASASSCSSPSRCFSSRSFCRMSSDALVCTKRR